MGSRTDKYKKAGSQPEVDLLPFMNLIMLLIPVLMMSTEYIKIATIGVSSPRIGPASASPADEKPEEKPPLNLTIAISSLGCYIASSNTVLPGANTAEGEAGPTIPKVNVSVYKGTEVATGQNKEVLRVWTEGGKKYILATRPISDEKLNERIAGLRDRYPDLRQTEVLDHNWPATQNKLKEIKKDWPDEKRVILTPEPNIKFTTIIRVMDSVRYYKDDEGAKQFLFPLVVLSAGVV